MAHASAYIWGFRRGEGVDLSYVKDFADLNHANLVSLHVNQLYIGWTAEDEWTNYTITAVATTSPSSCSSPSSRSSGAARRSRPVAPVARRVVRA